MFNNKRIKKIIIQIIIMCVLFGILNPLLSLIVIAESKEFEVKRFQEHFTLSQNGIETINFTFQEGKKLEIIYTIQVEGDHLIDIWFVTEDNYLLLSGGTQFLYYIDGSQQQISYAKKVVSLIKHDNYKLAITNYYSNQTIEVELNLEIRTYGLDQDNSSFLDTILFDYLLLTVIIILVITIIILIVKKQKYKHSKTKKQHLINKKQISQYKKDKC